jgi:hypothetical protein
MDFKKLGRYLVGLGLTLGLVCIYYAWLPYDMRWVEFEAIKDATMRGGYSPKLADINQQFELYGQRKYGFGIASAVITFLGVAIISSSKPSVSESDASWTCPTCEVSNPTGHGCKLCGESAAHPEAPLHH